MITKSLSMNGSPVITYNIVNTADAIRFPKEPTYMALGNTAFGIMRDGIVYDVLETDVPEHILNVIASVKETNQVKFPYFVIVTEPKEKKDARFS